MTETRLPSIQEWLQHDPIPWPGIGEPAEGARFAACYCVESKQILRTKGDKPYLRIQLADRSGTIEGRVWDDAERIDSWIRAGQYVGVRGSIQSFRNQRQLKIDLIEPIEVAPSELDLFLPTTTLDLVALEAGIDELIASVSEPPLRLLLAALVGPEAATGRAFRRAPAAKRNHHAYLGGLLEHTLSITRIADALAAHYGPVIDRDLLVTGAILHDIGKIQEIAVTGGFPYTDPGKLLGHILLGIELVRDAGRQIEGLTEERLLLVLHLIASHQGKYEWQSPKLPHTLEALILHFADDIDAKVNQATALVNTVDEGWTAYDTSFSREFFRHRGTEWAGEVALVAGRGAAKFTADHGSVPEIFEESLPEAIEEIVPPESRPKAIASREPEIMETALAAHSRLAGGERDGSERGSREVLEEPGEQASIFDDL